MFPPIWAITKKFNVTSENLGFTYMIICKWYSDTEFNLKIWIP